MNNNRIILFSNLKGGTGKSTICTHFANYLSAKGEYVIVLDADISQNIFHLRERELAANDDVDKPWDVWRLAGRDNPAEIMQKAKNIKGWILVDCPGTLNDPSLRYVFEAADAAVIPFRYDDFMVDSTISFVKVLKLVARNVKLLFLPNMIDVRIKNIQEESVKEMFRKVGTVLPRIKLGVAVQRLSTICPQNEYQERAVMYAFEEIIESVK